MSEIEMTDEQYWESNYDTLSWYPYRGFYGDVYHQNGGVGRGEGGWIDRGGVYMSGMAGAMLKRPRWRRPIWREDLLPPEWMFPKWPAELPSISNGDEVRMD